MKCNVLVVDAGLVCLVTLLYLQVGDVEGSREGRDSVSDEEEVTFVNNVVKSSFECG